MGRKTTAAAAERKAHFVKVVDKSKNQYADSRLFDQVSSLVPVTRKQYSAKLRTRLKGMRIMPLQSKLFKAAQRLEACLIQDSAHVAQGAVGEHIGIIQTALSVLHSASIDATELSSKAYGPSTAAAVLAYKKKRASSTGAIKLRLTRGGFAAPAHVGAHRGERHANGRQIHFRFSQGIR